MDNQEPIKIPINGVLDLHTFSPQEVKSLLTDYIEACRQKGITELKIIHGKGKSILKQKVHSCLQRRSEVIDFRDADYDQGSWGATIVSIKK